MALKKPVKKKTNKKKLEEILDVAAEELIEVEQEDLPFKNNIPKNIIAITPEQITKEIETVRPQPEQVEIHESTEANDFEFTRNTLFKLLQKASIVTDGILNLCQEMEHPRTYEVAGQLIKTTSEVAKDFYALRKTQVDLKKAKVPGDDIPPDLGSTNQVSGGDTYILTGTTTEILDAIRKTKEPKINN